MVIASMLTHPFSLGAAQPLNLDRRVVTLGIIFLLAFLSNPAVAIDFDTSDGVVSVNGWGYQLQGPGGSALLPGPLAVAPHDLLVIDFSRSGDEASKFTAQEVDDIRNSALGGNGERKVVAAYLSIGEASEFRTYWDPAWTTNGLASGALTGLAPSWLGPTNPNWPESRKVRYWESGWQAIVFNGSGTGWLDQIVTQGFDAAYLDIVDAYYFWAVEVAPGDREAGDPSDGDEKDAAGRMIDFIVALTTHARVTNPQFFVIPQNGAFILDALEEEDPSRKAAYLNAIGGIAVEDTYFVGGLDENNPLDPDVDKIAILQQDFLGNGKPVFAVDYVNTQPLIDDFVDRARSDGFTPYPAPSRDLDSLAPPVVTALPSLSPLGLGALIAWLLVTGFKDRDPRRSGADALRRS